MTMVMLSPSQIITLMLLSGCMIACVCPFGDIIWLDVNIDVIIWLGDYFSFTFCVIMWLDDNNVCLEHLLLSLAEWLHKGYHPPG
jgi:hypothetical protein